MVELKIRVIDARAKADLAELKYHISDYNEKALMRAAEYVRGVVQKDFLRGPRPEKLNVRTARLINSIQAETEREGEDTRAYIGSYARSDAGYNYPAYWEYDGSKHGGPRPFLRPAVEEYRDRWTTVWVKSLKQQVEKFIAYVDMKHA
jgi:hypothetical protein